MVPMTSDETRPDQPTLRVTRAHVIEAIPNSGGGFTHYCHVCGRMGVDLAPSLPCSDGEGGAKLAGNSPDRDALRQEIAETLFGSHGNETWLDHNQSRDAAEAVLAVVEPALEAAKRHTDAVAQDVARRFGAALAQRDAEIARLRAGLAAARGEHPSGFWSQREWEDWSNELAMRLTDDDDGEEAQEYLIERWMDKIVVERDEARRVIAAVEALHRPDGGTGGPGAMCVACTPGFGTEAEDPVLWPCPTAAALASGDQPG